MRSPIAARNSEYPAGCCDRRGGCDRRNTRTATSQRGWGWSATTTRPRRRAGSGRRSQARRARSSQVLMPDLLELRDHAPRERCGGGSPLGRISRVRHVHAVGTSCSSADKGAIVPCEGLKSAVHARPQHPSRRPPPYRASRARRHPRVLPGDIPEDVLAAAGIEDDFVQDNHSRSRGVVRGMHFQPGMAKLVRCVRGAIVDIVVDIAVAHQPSANGRRMS